MEKDSTSFWADIKKYEDTLSRDPKSYCFAPLSEVYRKLGLLDDAIGTAQRGVENHPEYIGGYMALGRAYYEKGMRQEARESLEKVTRATPENLLAQKLLSQIFQEDGDFQAAEQALRVLISFNPEDTESRLSLEALQRAKTAQEATGIFAESDEGSPFGESTIVPPEQGIEQGTVAWEQFATGAAMECPEDDISPREDFAFDEQADLNGPEFGGDDAGTAPLPTITLAELYEAQGYNERALAVYQDLLLNDPENRAIRQRVDILQQGMDAEETASPVMSGLDEEDAALSRHVPEVMLYPEMSVSESGEGTSGPAGSEEEVIETLEKWLDSIRRERACRSREL